MYCSSASDGSGGCSGEFQAFRASTGTWDFAQFWMSPYSHSFNASTANGSFSCYAQESNTALTAMWPNAMNARGYFDIWWDKNGNCLGLTLLNGSPYPSNW
jgi:hypothetical protein